MSAHASQHALPFVYIASPPFPCTPILLYESNRTSHEWVSLNSQPPTIPIDPFQSTEYSVICASGFNPWHTSLLGLV